MGNSSILPNNLENDKYINNMINGDILLFTIARKHCKQGNNQNVTFQIIYFSVALIFNCLMYFPLFVGVLCLSLFCYALLCVHSSFAIILKTKRKLIVLQIYCYYKCSVALAHGAIGCPAVYDCGISLSYSLTFCIFC